ncbi:MAG TPA: 23S rRNA (adenine(2503)-C(2))-methyltransferase RlmN [Anaerovoracaceae bacterium]|nr:23S rRNA (adenine(2503)-C(2))-methyltransferase RlmN [Anaerovoracaceae bacterium]
MRTDLMNLTLKETEQYLERLGEKKYRAKQVFGWIYKGAESFDAMTDLSLELRRKLSENAEIGKLKILKVQISRKDGTRKYLFGLKDGNSIESVFMKYVFGNTACISSQAGCRMGCGFCASAAGGLKRNLTAGEMTDQILSIEKDTGEKIGNVVVMGTGEPLDNYENLSAFIRNIHEKDGLNIGMRNITVSTCGLIPKIAELAKDFPQVNLAVSLHAPNDVIRNRLMPIARNYSMDELLDACKKHIAATGRRVTFEYALINGVNDSDGNAEELAKRLRGVNCHVNLIPMNQVAETGYAGTDKAGVERFRGLLEKRGIQVTVRRELGSDIDAACGQLRLLKI